MALDNAKNFAKVAVSTGYDASATTVVLTASEGAKLPTAPFNATWYNATDYTDPTDDPNVEIVRVTDVTTDTLTITRAQESTTAKTHNTGGKAYKMIAGITAKVINTDILTTVVNTLHPVGSIYINATDSTNPGTLFGVGTWVAFGAGKVIVGLNGADTDFDVAEETGGAKTHTHTGPSHTHTGVDHLHSLSAHKHLMPVGFGTGATIYVRAGGDNAPLYGSEVTTDNGATVSTGSFGSRSLRVGYTNSPTTDSTGAADRSLTTGAGGTGNTGSGSSLQPYIVCYLWKRTA